MTNVQDIINAITQLNNRVGAMQAGLLAQKKAIEEINTTIETLQTQLKALRETLDTSVDLGDEDFPEEDDAEQVESGS